MPCANTNRSLWWCFWLDCARDRSAAISFIGNCPDISRGYLMIIIVQIWLIVIAPGDPARFLWQVISAFQPICRVLFKNFSRRIEHALNLLIFSRILYSFHCILFCLRVWLIHSIAFSFINLLLLLIQILQWFIRFLHTNKTKEYFIACISFFLSLSPVLSADSRAAPQRSHE